MPCCNRPHDFQRPRLRECQLKTADTRTPVRSHFNVTVMMSQVLLAEAPINFQALQHLRQQIDADFSSETILPEDCQGFEANYGKIL